MASNFTLKNGQVFVLAETAGGVYNSEQIRKVVELADEESAFIKITEDQRIGFMIEAGRADAVAEALAGVGLALRSYRSSGPVSPKVCLGELCPHAQQDAMGDGVELSIALARSFGTEVAQVTMGVNGCEQACVGSAVDDIHIVGEESGYKVAIGGRTREFPQLGQFLTENVERERLPQVVETVLKVFLAHRENDERMCDVMERVGTGVFLEALEGGAAPAEAESDASEELVLDEAPETEVLDTLEEQLVDEEPAAALDVAEEETLVDAEPSVSTDAIEEETLLDAGPLETGTELLVDDDALDIPLDAEATVVDAELDDIPLDEGLREKLDGPTFVDDEEELLDASAAPLSAEVDVDEELRTVESRKAAVREMNADVDADLAVGEAGEELLLDDEPLLDSVPEAVPASDPEVAMIADSEVGMEEMVDTTSQEAPVAPECDAAAVEPVADASVSAPEELEASSDSGNGISLDDADLTLPCEEGTLEDVERMRDAIRSEVSTEEPLAAPASAAPSLPGIDDSDCFEELSLEEDLITEPADAVMEAVAQEVADGPEAAGPSEVLAAVPAAAPEPVPEPVKNVPKPPVRKVMPRLKVKMGENEVRVVLPSGIECAVPLDWLESEGAFEMDVGDQTLCVERAGDMIHFRYGSLALSVPVVPVAA